MRPAAAAARSELEDLAELASEVIGVPMAGVTLVHEEEQTFEARTGLTLDRVEREGAFCAHAVEQPGEPLVVEDALEDKRFRENPYVTGAPNIRFYAGAPITTPRGQAVGTLCVMDDEPRELSQQKRQALVRLRSRVERELEQGAQRRSPDDQTEAFERFAAFVAHELKGPLTAVVGNLELLADGAEERMKTQDARNVRDALEAADRLESTLGDLDAYARTQTASEGHREVALDRIVDEVAEEVEHELKATEGRLEAGMLPSVRGHPGLLRMLFRNLVENAIKYHGERPPRITIEAEPSDTMWRVAVHDNGRGIEAGEIGDLFGLFERRGADPVEGSGVGLALSKRIVDRHGGEVWVESEPGEGTSVYLTLPRC